MNHGKVNEKYYSGVTLSEPKTNIYEMYPELLRLRNYFRRSSKRDRYYVAMKYHAIDVAKQIYPELCLEQLAEIINVANHATVLYYTRKYLPLTDHKEFIKNNFDNFINNYLYPVTPKTLADIKQYGLVKPVYLDVNNPDKEEKKQRKRAYRVGRTKR